MEGYAEGERDAANFIVIIVMNFLGCDILSATNYCAVAFSEPSHFGSFSQTGFPAQITWHVSLVAEATPHLHFFDFFFSVRACSWSAQSPKCAAFKGSLIACISPGHT